MAYLTQTIEAGGIPRTEYRYEPDLLNEVPEPQILTIEFTPSVHPNDDEYTYPHPKFVFGDMVALTEHWEYCCEHHISLTEELDYFCICALELVEPKAPSGRLTDPPSWLYGIRSDRGTCELLWFEEAELISKRQISQGEEDLVRFVD